MTISEVWKRLLGRPRQESPQDVSGRIAVEELTPTQPATTPGEDRPSPAEPIRTISTISELDEKLKEVDAAHAVSDDAVRKELASFRFVVDSSSIPSDPFSKEYEEFQFRLYELISGRPYRIENERTSFLNDDPGALPFPYYTKSWKTVSDHILLVGLIIKTLELSADSSILEFGAGWGNTTLALSQTGYKVTAVDIERRYLNVVRHRCRELGNQPRLLERDFSLVNELGEKFDAILFDASFHHCSDHRALLGGLRNRLKPGGKVLFAAEPIDETLPMPWGLRLDGGSVWATRCFGWLELGFRESYFREAASRAGLSIEKFSYPLTDLGTLYVARANEC